MIHVGCWMLDVEELDVGAVGRWPLGRWGSSKCYMLHVDLMYVCLHV